MTPKFYSLSNSLLIGSKATKDTILFGLNTGVAFSLTLNFAFAFLHVPRAVKTSGNFLCNLVLNLSIAVILLVVTLFPWLQNELHGRSQRSNKAIPFVQNKFVVFFNKSSTAFFGFFPRKRCYREFAKINFPPDTPQATFLEVNKLDLPIFFRSFC